MNYPQIFYPQGLQTILQKETLSPPSQPPSVVLKAVPNAPHSFDATPYLLGIWLLWLGGILGGAITTILTSFSVIALLFLLGGYSCLMALFYFAIRQMDNPVSPQNQPQVYPQQFRQPKTIKPDSLLPQEHLKQIQHFSLQKRQPIGKSQAKQGISEVFFLEHLKTYFPVVRQGEEFSLPNFHHNYSADFIIIHSPTGLGINCEVDEPYTLKSKKPTHCINQPQDRNRNLFFLNSGWIVVRFSEKQVIKAPRSCCKVIAEVIAKVTGDRESLMSLENEPNLLPEKGWTVKEAKLKARKNYRLSYLPETASLPGITKRSR